MIMKFDEDSLASPEAVRQTVQRVARRAGQFTATGPRVPIVVTSAISGVTAALIDGAQKAAAGDKERYLVVQKELWDKHRMIARQSLHHHKELVLLNDLIERYLYQYTQFCHSLMLLGEVNKRGLDVISSLGTRMSAPLLAAVMRTDGLKAEFVDASELIITDDTHGCARPLMALTSSRCRTRLAPMLEQSITPVIPGCIGATQRGVLTTLGQQGADYAAAIIGVAMGVQEIEFWAGGNSVMKAEAQAVLAAHNSQQVNYRSCDFAHDQRMDNVEDVVILGCMD